MSQMGEGLKYNKSPVGFKIWPLCLFAKMLLRNNFKIYIRHTGMKKTEREVYKILKWGFLSSAFMVWEMKRIFTYKTFIGVFEK